MRFEEHCAQCLREFGEPFENVHRWLDEFAGTKGYGMRHRRVRHHLAGIEEARILFGDRGAEAARMHIAADFAMEGWKEGEHFPENECGYKKMGLY